MDGWIYRWMIGSFRWMRKGFMDIQMDGWMDGWIDMHG